MMPSLTQLRFYFVLLSVGTIFVICFCYFILTLPVFIFLNEHSLADFTTSKLCWYLFSKVTCIKLEVDNSERVDRYGTRYTDTSELKKRCVFVGCANGAPW
jgi:hypothetical protein